MAAKKDSMDAPKLRWSLLLVDFRDALECVAEVLDQGASSYGVRNWMEEDGREEFVAHLKDARERHYTSHLSGELLDKKSGKPHMAHVSACDLMLLKLEVLCG